MFIYFLQLKSNVNDIKISRTKTEMRRKQDFSNILMKILLPITADNSVY